VDFERSVWLSSASVVIGEVDLGVIYRMLDLGRGLDPNVGANMFHSHYCEDNVPA
jgi:hypothetical protein